MQSRLSSLSIVVPTYKEAESLPHLLERVSRLRGDHQLDLELLILDDQSRDGSAEVVQAANLPWVQFIERSGPRGLSVSVVDGLKIASKDIVVVMDGDLSHPPESVPKMVSLLNLGYDFVVGSRYVEGGSTDDDWGFLRWLNSRIATLLAKPLTSIRDPMSGFFAMKRARIDFSDLNPTGYKIALELLVKCGIRRPIEIPIHFSDRKYGASKLTLKQQLLYLQHLRRLYMYRFATSTEFFHFALVGASGVVVNLAMLSLLVAVGVGTEIAVAIAIVISMISNFFLNRRLTFWYAKDGSVLRQFFGFMLACSVGAVVNYLTTVGTLRLFPSVPLLVAALFGVGAGLGFNFLANRFVVFRKRYFRHHESSEGER